jgi:hypothetical protein
VRDALASPVPVTTTIEVLGFLSVAHTLAVERRLSRHTFYARKGNRDG